MTLKGITGLYVEMLRKMNITTIKQYKKLCTHDDLRFFHIIPEQHQMKYVHRALRHINQTSNKTSPKAKPSIRELSVGQYREQMLADIIKRIESLPNSDDYKASLMRTRKLIEEQIRPPPGTA